MRLLASRIYYISGELDKSAETLLESLMLLGRDGSVARIPPSVGHLEDTTDGGLLGPSPMDLSGPKDSV